jgi:HEAT repeat protein
VVGAGDFASQNARFARKAGGGVTDRPARPVRKLFFGLFVFPLLIAVGMAVLLCTAVLLTTEEETPESLIAAVKSGSPSKRWQKAFELSNELNRGRAVLRDEGVMNEVIHILRDRRRYDARTRAYMAGALARFESPRAVEALVEAAGDEEQDVRLHALWSIGRLGRPEAGPRAAELLAHPDPQTRKVAAYVAGTLGLSDAAPALAALLEDPVEDVRWNAALALARLGDPSARPVLARMLDRERLERGSGLGAEAAERVMVNAAKGLALVGGAEERPLLERVARGDRSLRVRQAAMETLKTLNGGV